MDGCHAQFNRNLSKTMALARPSSMQPFTNATVIMSPTALIESSLANPLATPDQLTSSGSRLDDVPADLEASAIFLGSRLTQIAGILLRLQQDTIAQAIVIFTRFWIGPDGGSLREYSVKVRIHDWTGRYVKSDMEM
jgi:hypothetical protein